MSFHPTRTVRKAITATALAATVLVGMAVPAEATVNSGLESVTGATTCSSGNRTMTLGASIMLNWAHRQGAWVAYRFRYFAVNAAGVRTSPITGTYWYGPFWVDTVVDTPSGYPMNSPVTLNGGNVVWAGTIDVQVDVAVWTGTSYVYTGWMDINGYTNTYWSGLMWESSYDSFCRTAM